MSSPNNINDLFFEGSYQSVWKKINPPGLTVAETEFIVEVAGLHEGSRVVDLMCGYGRHALEMARRKIYVTAVDNLETYINEINEAASKENLPIEAIQSGVLQMQLHGMFDAAVCMGNSFAFFNKHDAITLLQNISDHLNEGGTLIINSWMIAEIAIRHFREKEWYHVDEYKCLLDNKFCFNPSRIETEQTIISPDGSAEVIKGVDYIFTLDELEAMFEQAGLTTKALYSTPRKRPFVFGDTRIYIVAGKKVQA